MKLLSKQFTLPFHKCFVDDMAFQERVLSGFLGYSSRKPACAGNGRAVLFFLFGFTVTRHDSVGNRPRSARYRPGDAKVIQGSVVPHLECSTGYD